MEQTTNQLSSSVLPSVLLSPSVTVTDGIEPTSNTNVQKGILLRFYCKYYNY